MLGQLLQFSSLCARPARSREEVLHDRRVEKPDATAQCEVRTPRPAGARPEAFTTTKLQGNAQCDEALREALSTAYHCLVPSL